MKIAHFSDLHYAPETLEEVNRCFASAVKAAISRGAEAAVISGDLFDHRIELHAPAVAELLAHVHALANHMPVLILQGTHSHDAPGSLEVFRTLSGAHRITVADSIGQIALTSQGHWNHSPGWRYEESDVAPLSKGIRCLFSCLPSVNKGAVAAAVGTEKVSHAVGEQVYNLLKAWAPINEGMRTQGVPTVLVSHGTVSGSVTEHGVPMAGLDHEFTTGSLFAAECSSVMLGHIHQHQEWVDETGKRRIAYPGSIGRLHFGELTPKGFLLWDVDATTASFQFIETPAKRLLQIDFDGPPDMAALREQLKQANGAHVRIRYSIDEEHRHSVDKEQIIKMFDHAAKVKIEARVNPIQRTRADGINKAVSLADKLTKWANVTETDPEPLLPRLAALQSFDPERLVLLALGEGTKEQEDAA